MWKREVLRMRLPSFAYPENLVVEDDPPKPAVPDNRLDITAHEYLKSLYQDPNQPPSLRLRAAVKAIEVETPRISATANVLFDGATFADALERCIQRSQSPPQLNGSNQHEELVPASELKKPFPSYRRF
jgi:hypothetical protein